jgi:hypothetical protein
MGRYFTIRKEIMLDQMADTAYEQGHWNLRVIEFDAGADCCCAVHEVHYAAGGRLPGYVEHPAFVMWTVNDELGAPQPALERIQRALSEPPINVK